MRRVHIKNNKQNTIIASALGIISICICGQLFSKQSSQNSPSAVAIPSYTSQEVVFSEPLEESPTPILPAAAPTLEQVSFVSPDCIPGQQPVQAHTTYVVDGDTIKVDILGEEFTVRLIGIDTPEIAHGSQAAAFLADEAASRTTELVAGKEIILYKDVSEEDQYGRLLRYVMVEDLFVNQVLVQEGFAYSVSYPPDTACQKELDQSQESAIAEFAGIWTANHIKDSNTEETIVINSIFYNGVEGDHEPDEFVSIINNGNKAINLQGWSLKDESRKTFHFPNIKIEPGQICKVYTNQDHPESCGLNWNYTNSAIWNNGGDCGYLIDSDNEIVSKYCY